MISWSVLLWMVIALALLARAMRIDLLRGELSDELYLVRCDRDAAWDQNSTLRRSRDNEKVKHQQAAERCHQLEARVRALEHALGQVREALEREDAPPF